MRTVGVTGTNVMNYFYTVLNLTVSGGCVKITPNAKGEVTLSEAPSGDAFCVEPIKSLTSSVALTGKNIYFVPAFDFEGIKVNGSDVTITDVKADGNSLYKLAAGATVSKVSL